MTMHGLHRPALAIATALLSCSAMLAHGAEATWPRRLDTEKGQLTIYQPQPEKFDGNTLTGRAAASLKAANQKDPTFGVFWFTARVERRTAPADEGRLLLAGKRVLIGAARGLTGALIAQTVRRMGGAPDLVRLKGGIPFRKDSHGSRPRALRMASMAPG